MRAVLNDEQAVCLCPAHSSKKKKKRAASLATGAREAPEVEPSVVASSVVASSGAALYIRAVSGVRDAAGAAHGGDVVDDAVMEDASEGVPCSVSDSDSGSESCAVLLPATAAAVLAAMMPAVSQSAVSQPAVSQPAMSQPAVLSVVTGQFGVSVSSVCDGVVLASSVVEVVEEMKVQKEESHHGRL